MLDCLRYQLRTSGRVIACCFVANSRLDEDRVFVGGLLVDKCARFRKEGAGRAPVYEDAHHDLNSALRFAYPMRVCASEYVVSIHG